MAKGRKKKRYYREGGSMDPDQLQEEIDFVNGLEVPKPAEVKDERFELIELWGGEWSGSSAEAVLHEMLPIGDQMSLQLRDQILVNDRLREENGKLYRLIPDELREAYLEWLTDGEDDESFSSYLGTHRSMNLLDELAARLRNASR